MTVWPKWDAAVARDLVVPHSNVPGGLLPALHGMQEHFGCVAQGAIDLAADVFNLSRAEVYGVVNFYDDFRKTPPEMPVLKICMAEACQAVGAEGLKRHAVDLAGGRMEIEDVFCLGNCACGPSVMAGSSVHGRVSPERLDTLVGLLEGGGE